MDWRSKDCFLVTEVKDVRVYHRIIEIRSAMRRKSRESWKDCGQVVKNTGE